MALSKCLNGQKHEKSSFWYVFIQILQSPEKFKKKKSKKKAFKSPNWLT